MVVRVAYVRLQRCGVKLRIRLDKVLRELIEPKNGAVDAGRNVRQRGVDAAHLAVVQGRE